MTKKIELKTTSYYELEEILDAIEANGFRAKRKVWLEYVTEYGVSRGTIGWLGFDYLDKTDIEKYEEYTEYFQEVNKLLGLPIDNDGIMAKIV